MEDELKYIHEEDVYTIFYELLGVFKKNGFRIKKFDTKDQIDEYYDTLDYKFYLLDESLRIRNKGDNKYKGTLKRVVDNSLDYLKREEIESIILASDIKLFVETLKSKNIEINEELMKVLLVKNYRIDANLEKNGVRVCVSFDDVTYFNQINNSTSTDKMIEIELKGSAKEDILTEIHTFISREFPKLEKNKESKYRRGVDKTNPSISLKLQK